MDHLTPVCALDGGKETVKRSVALVSMAEAAARTVNALLSAGDPALPQPAIDRSKAGIAARRIGSGHNRARPRAALRL
jgi:hypothetical protein